MGTRNLTMVILDGKPKVAQYGQWDGYPEGTGLGVLNFLSDCNMEMFKQAVSECIFLSEHEIGQKWAQCGADESGFVGLDVSANFKNKFPALHRDVGSDVLGLIVNGARHLKDSSHFAGDSLFCEWAYVVDLDTNAFEVYEGFNKSPLSQEDRFFSCDGCDEYHPVRKVASWPINGLPTEEEFLSTFKEEAPNETT